MNKKIGFWHWFFTRPIAIFLWILGKGKEASKGDILSRGGLATIIVMITSFIILFVYDFFTNFSLTKYNIFFVPLVPVVLGYIILLPIIIYYEYLSYIKKVN